VFEINRGRVTHSRVGNRRNKELRIEVKVRTVQGLRGDYVTNTIVNLPDSKNPIVELSESSYPDSKSLRGINTIAYRTPQS